MAIFCEGHHSTIPSKCIRHSLGICHPIVVTSLIFIILQSKRIIQFEDPGVPYPLFVITGTLLWQIFIEGLNAPLKSTIQAKPILAKINFPYEALILSAIYNVLFSFILKSIILVIGFAILQPTTNKWYIFCAPRILHDHPARYRHWSFTNTLRPVVYGCVLRFAAGKPTLVLYYTCSLSNTHRKHSIFVTVANPISPLLIAARNLT